MRRSVLGTSVRVWFLGLAIFVIYALFMHHVFRAASGG